MYYLKPKKCPLYLQPIRSMLLPEKLSNLRSTTQETGQVGQTTCLLGKTENCYYKTLPFHFSSFSGKAVRDPEYLFSQPIPLPESFQLGRTTFRFVQKRFDIATHFF